MKRMMGTLSAVAALCLFGSQALGFESSEHKKLGDRAAVDAFKGITATYPGVKVEGGKVQIWAGSASTPGQGGGWFSFGELIAIFGDFMRDVDDLRGWEAARYSILKNIVGTDDSTGDSK